MKFQSLPLAGAFVVTPEPREDERGFFARIFCSREFIAAGVEGSVVQCNNSLSRDRGTTRGLHFQIGPHQETKLLRVVKGRVANVIVDLNPGSPTFLKHTVIDLDATSRRMTYVPRGFANGIQTQEDDTELIYFVSKAYEPSAERGIRWDDPRLSITWPIAPTVISEKDRRWPDFDPATHRLD